jgi:uncharacterized OsmC-like protein
VISFQQFPRNRVIIFWVEIEECLPTIPRVLCEGATVGKLLHTSKVKIQKEPGRSKIKRAQVEGFPDVLRMGIHGGIAQYFKLSPDEPMPATLDYIVAAVGGCMTGTVAGALEARGVRADPEKLQVEAEGKIEEVDGKMILTGIKLRYHLKVPKDKRATVERALEHHEGLCAASESVRRGITVEWQSEIEEESESDSGKTAAATVATSYGKD